MSLRAAAKKINLSRAQLQLNVKKGQRFFIPKVFHHLRAAPLRGTHSTGSMA
jgi:hypothetical protein